MQSTSNMCYGKVNVTKVDTKRRTSVEELGKRSSFQCKVFSTAYRDSCSSYAPEKEKRRRPSKSWQFARHTSTCSSLQPKVTKFIRRNSGWNSFKPTKRCKFIVKTLYQQLKYEHHIVSNPLLRKSHTRKGIWRDAVAQKISFIKRGKNEKKIWFFGQQWIFWKQRNFKDICTEYVLKLDVCS